MRLFLHENSALDEQLSEGETKSRHQQRTNTSPRNEWSFAFMNRLTKATVLVLNRNWQAINVRTPQEAFCMMATNVAAALEIEGEDHIRPVTWDEWITLR